MEGIDYKIKRVRARKTLVQMSRELDMSTGMLSMFENNKYVLSDENQKKIDRYWREKEDADR